MVRRSRLEIYFEILKVVEEGVVKPTPIMYHTGLSWVPFQDIFNTLLESGFLQEEQKGNTKTYKVTDKGRKALSYHLKASDELSKPDELPTT